MLKEVKHKKRKLKRTLLDRIVAVYSPEKALSRMRARIGMELLGSYAGASKTRRALSAWSTQGYDADSDIIPDLDTLRQRSRDLTRNNPLAASAIKTKLVNVVGTGFLMKSHVDRDVLNLTDDQADQLEADIEREYRLFWQSKDLDISRISNGPDLTRLVYQQTLENGDVFVVLPRVQIPGAAYSLRLQTIEADRVCNKDNAADSSVLSGGVKKDKYGAPVEYHIMRQHPGAVLSGALNFEWDVIPAFGEKTGLRNIIHLYNPTRPGQTRGVPDIAPVVEALKQLGRYTEAEIMAAVVSGMFTVFIETPTGDTGETIFDYTDLGGEVGQAAGDKDMKLGNGLVMNLAEGEKVHDTNPGRPNTSFDAFVTSIVRQIGAALGIPFEILVKQFNASYSASRAALLAMWQYVMAERRWLCDNFLKPIFEVWFYEAVVTGRINAPGFFSDPAIKAAYLGCEFIGPSKGQINEQAEVKAAIERVGAGLSTLARETAELTGADWERNHIQQVKEQKKRIDAGLIDAPFDNAEVKINE